MEKRLNGELLTDSHTPNLEIIVALVGVLGFLLVENTGSPSRSWPCSALAGFTSVSQHWSYGKEIRGVSMISLIFLAFPFTWLGSFCLTFDFVGSFPFLLCYCLKSKSSFSSLKSIIICVCFTENIFANLDFFLVFFYGFSCCTYSLFALPPQSSHFKLISQLNTLGNLEDWVWGDALFPRVETIVKRSGELFKKVT